MNVTIGTAPDSWGVWFPDDPRQTPWQRFLDEVTEAGYKWIELGPRGYLPTALSELRDELDKRGLKVSGSFITGDLADPAGWPKLESELRALGPTLKGLGASFLALIEDLYTDHLTGAPLGGLEWTRRYSSRAAFLGLFGAPGAAARRCQWKTTQGPGGLLSGIKGE